MSQALVSILIPCYNAERWIGEAIESALAQSWPSKEIIVVDDGSTDGSSSIIERYESRITRETGPNRGGNAARNRLLELSSGQWLQYLDADDVLLPDKISDQMGFLSPESDADVIFGPVTMEYWSEEDTRRELLEIPAPRDPWVLLARWYLPQTGASLWRREALLDVGGWKPSQPCCQEHDLYLRLLMAGKEFRYCARNGAIYRQWGHGTVCNRDPSEVHRRRLEIEQAAEDFLRDRGELTRERLCAINQARFEIARMVWQYSPALAGEIMDGVRRSQQDFLPSGKVAAVPYRIAYQLFGFARAERLASWRRMRRGQWRVASDK